MAKWQLFVEEIPQFGSLALQKRQKGKWIDRRHILGRQVAVMADDKVQRAGMGSQDGTASSGGHGCRSPKAEIGLLLD